MERIENKPNGTIGYSMTQGLFYMSLYAVMGLVVVYLNSAGFNYSVIGVIISVCSLISALVVIPIGSATDRSNRLDPHHVSMIIVLSIVLASSLLIIGLNKGVALVLIYGFLIAASQINIALINALGMFFENRGIHINYGVARGVGSIMYALASVFISKLADEDMYGAVVIPIAILVVDVILFVSLLVFGNHRRYLKNDDDTGGTDEAASTPAEEGRAVSSGKKSGIIGFIKQYPWIVLFSFAIIILMVPHNTLNSYMIVFLKPLGGGVKEQGIVLAIAAVFELPTMFAFSRIKQRFSSGSLIICAGIFFTIKTVATLLTLLSDMIVFIYAIQLLQMLSYALIIPAMVYFGNELVKKENEVQSQSFIGFAITMSGVVGNLIGGLLSESFSVIIILIILSVISAVGAFLTWITVKMCEKHKVVRA